MTPSISLSLDASFCKEASEWEDSLKTVTKDATTSSLKKPSTNLPFRIYETPQKTVEIEPTRIRSQRELFAILIALRIRLQKPLEAANRLPLANTFDAYCTSEIKQKNCTSMPLIQPASSSNDSSTENSTIALEFEKLQDSACSLLKQIISLRDSIFQIPDADETNLSDLKDSSDAFSIPEPQKFIWDQKVDQWNRGLKRKSLMVADIWKSRTTVSNQQSFSVLDQSVSQQFHSSLQHYSTRLDQTQLPVDQLQIFGYKRPKITEASTDINDEELKKHLEETYDDRDLYVQLLKEMISEGPSRTEAIENIKDYGIKHERHSKKKACDRRASKGRKLRLEPIPKLQNFVASAPHAIDLWDPQKPNSLSQGEFEEAQMIQLLVNSMFKDA